VEVRVLTINEAVSAGLPTARDVLNSVDKCRLYEVGGEVILSIGVVRNY
jgi:hypothetical protein